MVVTLVTILQGLASFSLLGSLNEFSERKTLQRPRISLSRLPSATKLEYDFLDSSSFQSHHLQKNSLPTPQEVRALSARSGSQQDLVKFEDLGLIVKFGLHVTVVRPTLALHAH